MEIYKNLQVDSINYLDDEGVVRIEQWKPVFGYEELYHVSDLGRIKSLEQKRFMQVNKAYAVYKECILRQSITKTGYLKSTLTKIRKRTFLSHRLVGQAFIPNPENKPQINHKKGIKTDNRCCMLEWCDSHENVQHAYDINLTKPNKGIKNGCAKLTEEEVLQIRDIGNSMLKKDIAKKYNVGSTTISRVLSKSNWKHI